MKLSELIALAGGRTDGPVPDAEITAYLDGKPIAVSLARRTE